MKKIIMPDNLNQIKLTKNKVDGYIIGIKGMSVNTSYDIDIDNIDDIINILQDKEIFISLNKNIENKELQKLQDILIILNKFSITGVLYSDVCFINLKAQLHLNYDLVWTQEHLTTNYETINYWHEFGVNYTFVSSDITVSEIIDIKKNTNVKLMTMIFGHLPMFVSKRRIVKNYLNYFNLKDLSHVNYIEKEGKEYPIIDSDIATTVFSSNVLNGIRAYCLLKKSGMDYIVFNGFNIEDSVFVSVIDIYNNLSQENIENSYDDISGMISNIDEGFMYQETISRVKKNEK